MKALGSLTSLVLLGALTSLSGCQENLPPPVEPVPPPAESVLLPPPDPMGERPKLDAAKGFEPAAPEVFKAPNGMTVWLLERHALPLVSVSIAVPYGSAHDPKDQAGLAHITADMMDEGAGKRSALELSTAINDLGAQIGVGASVSGSVAQLSVLKKNFRQGFDILADVVARPRFDAKEWKRVSALWKNDLKKRPEEPVAVSRLVMSAALFSPESPYGHPADGFVGTAAKIGLPAVKAFHSTHWRPDQATLTIAGDITRAEITEAINASLGAWKTPKNDAPPVKLAISRRATLPRIVLVDRPDAPQSVIAVMREGVTADAPEAPILDLVNTALGGSFTSRLNQDLREDHGWTYGARSTFVELKGRGMFYASCSVVTEATGQALSAMIADLDKMATGGLDAGELDKVKAQDRADLVQTYESLGGITGRLAKLSMLGLPPGFDAAASKKRQAATLEELKTLAGAVSPKGATIVVVGPRETVTKQLEVAGLGAPELWDAEGSPIKK